MNSIINIGNYEGFYLDYLEGNLGEEETQALFLFLEQHPELLVDEEELPVVSVSDSISATDFKQSLKVFDETEQIHAENAELFMIAAVEQQLNAQKQEELDSFLAPDKSLQHDFSLYRQTILKADQNLIYPSKSSLKRGFVIPMYAKAMAVAASLIFILLLYPFNTPETVFNGKTASYMNSSLNPKKIKIAPNQLAYTGTVSSKSEKAKNSFNETVLTAETRFHLEPKKVQLPEGENSFSRVESSLFASASFPVKMAKDQEESAYLSLAEMKNPIKPITNSLNSKFNQDLDFRTAKASKTKQGGFYLKIGRFEISRKTAPQEVLAAK